MKILWIALLFTLVSCASHQGDQRNPASEQTIDEGITAESYMLSR